MFQGRKIRIVELFFVLCINFSIFVVDFVNMQVDFVCIVMVDFVYVDVMDNYFVFNFIFGMQMVEWIQVISFILLDVYLMIIDFECWVLDYVEFGVVSVMFYFEVVVDFVFFV